MRKFFSEYKKPAISAVVFFVTLAGMSYAYAAFTSLLNVGSGDRLKSTDWNAVIANLNDLNGRSVPQGAVMAFFWTICPANWSPADGTANGVKMTDGTAGTLDLRGEFIRGLDSAWVGARSVDTSRTLGSWQKPSILPHDWNNNNRLSGLVLNWSSNLESIGQENVTKNGYTSHPSDVAVSLIAATATYGLANPILLSDSHGGTIRPRNVALLYCVKN